MMIHVVETINSFVKEVEDIDTSDIVTALKGLTAMYEHRYAIEYLDKKEQNDKEMYDKALLGLSQQGNEGYN